MKTPLLLLLIICFKSHVFSQNKTDSVYSNAITEFYGKAYQHLYTQEDSAYYYFNKINSMAIKHGDFESLISSISASNKTAGHFYNLERMKTNLERLDSIVLKNDSELKKTENYLIYINSIWLDKGLYYFRLNDYDKSRKAFQAIITSIETLNSRKLNIYLIDLLTSAYSFIAKMYVNDGKYNLAKDYYTKNIHFLESNKADDIVKINRTYSLLAEVLKNQKQLDSSNSYFNKSLKYNLVNNGSSSSIVTEANHLLENYLNQSQIDSANYYLNIIKKNLPDKHPRWNVYYEAKAKIHIATGAYEMAEEELQIALDLIKQKWKNQPHNDVAEAYNNIGLLHAKFKNPTKALENYNLALQQFSEINNSSTINQTVVLKILKNKALALNSLKLYSENLLTIDQALETLDQLKPTFKSNTDKLFLMEEAFPVFESGLEAVYNLYQETKQDSLLDKAFYYSEKSKSVLLLEAILSTKATKFANIPKDIIEKEQLLKSKINHLEKQINHTKNQALEDRLFDVKNNYRELITTIENRYKTYYDLKYNSKVINIKELQTLLDTKDALLSYFYGNHHIYTITITKNSKHITRCKLNNDLENNIVSLYKLLNNPKSNLEELNSKSFYLYTKLVAPNIDNLSHKNLIIVTDGLLNYIPFSSFSTNGRAKYVIENHAISYVNSATLFKQLSEKEGINNKVLAFAPSFDASINGNLMPLPNNQTEAEDILNYFNGKTLTNTQATLQNFNTESEHYGLLHFATHAILNDETPEYSYLAFQPNNTNSNLLYVSDLYNLNLNTNLVTLSACESGIGNLKRGEGFLSLARGFYFGGASSISSTLWKINDGSTLKIMDAFYKNLSEGNSKSLALQQAQVSFLNENSQNALVHPYYWSGFIISGNTSAIATTNNWLWYVAIGVVLLLIIGLLVKKNQKSS